MSDRWSAEGFNIRYSPTPGGKRNADGSTTYSLSFHALSLTEYVSEPEQVAKQICNELNLFPKAIGALRALAEAARNAGNAGRHTPLIEALDDADRIVRLAGAAE